MTPPIPNWIRSYRCNKIRYTNIYELLPKEKRLYGTESLYGDWDGELLLLAQDFSPKKLLEDRLAKGDSNPYRHKRFMRTNCKIMEYTREFQHGILYGSALAGMLRNEETGGLPSYQHMMDDGHLQSILRFTIENMKKLRAIACLGEVAWEVTADTLGLQSLNRTAIMDHREPVVAGEYMVFALAHPARDQSARGSQEVAKQDWDSMIGFLHTKAKAA